MSNRKALLCLGVLVWALVPLIAPAELSVAPDAEPIRDAVLAWVNALESFDGEYTVHQKWPGDADARAMTFQVVYRFDGENRYMATTKTDNRGRLVTHIDALLGRDLRSLHAVEGEDAVVRRTGVTGLGEESWLFPPGSILTPEMLFGRLTNRITSLTEFMAEGQTELFHRDGQTVLRHTNAGRIVDIWLDAHLRISQYDLSYTDFASEEVKAHWPGDHFEVRSLRETLNLGRYEDIDGVPFPAQAVLTSWTRDAEQREALRAERDATGMLDIQYFIRLCTEVPLSPYLIQEFDLDIASTRVNAPIPRSSFRIAFEEGTVVFNEHGVRIDNLPWWRRHPGLAAAVGIGLGVAVLAAGAMLAYRKLA